MDPVVETWEAGTIGETGEIDNPDNTFVTFCAVLVVEFIVPRLRRGRLSSCCFIVTAR